MNDQNIILSIHYHKTGCLLSRQLYKILGNYINDYIHIKDPIKKRIFKWDSNNCVKFEKIKFRKEKNQVYNQAAPNYFKDIFSEMPQINKIIHLVRESYDWCLSNYLYHIQYPTPEKWFKKVNTDINQWFNEKELRFMCNEINLDFKHIQNLINYIKSVYNCPIGKNYYQYLRSICPKKGIIIETTRFLLNNKRTAGCDHLRMAINSKYLSSNTNKVLTLHMNDFRGNNIGSTLKKLFTFFVDDKILKTYLKGIKSDFKKKYKKTKKKKRKHITYNKVPQDYKKKLLNSLKKNKEISFILNFINLITPKSYFMNKCNI